MNNNTNEAITILKTFNIRLLLKNAFNDLIEYETKYNTRRGVIHTLIAEHCNLTLNNKFCKELKGYMKHLPIREITIDGKRYYQGVRLKNHGNKI